MLVAAQDTVTDSLCKKYTWQQGSTEIIHTLFFCFEWSQIEEEMVHLVAVEGSALIAISIFVLRV